MGHSMFGKVIVDDEHILALVHKVFRNGHPRNKGQYTAQGPALLAGGVQDDAVPMAPCFDRVL